jgi:hypothetical protein
LSEMLDQPTPSTIKYPESEKPELNVNLLMKQAQMLRKLKAAQSNLSYKTQDLKGGLKLMVQRKKELWNLNPYQENDYVETVTKRIKNMLRHVSQAQLKQNPPSWVEKLFQPAVLSKPELWTKSESKEGNSSESAQAESESKEGNKSESKEVNQSESMQAESESKEGNKSESVQAESESLEAESESQEVIKSESMQAESESQEVINVKTEENEAKQKVAY